MLVSHMLNFFSFIIFSGKAYESDKTYLNLTENIADTKRYCTIMYS